MLRIVKSDAEWREALAPDQYHVCREGGTEAPWSGCFLHHDKDGHYLCGCCGVRVFDSHHKYDAGTGWASFFDVAAPWAVRLRHVTGGGARHQEAVCGTCGAHLGLVYLDGPDPTGLRWSINSVALAFEPRDP